jgi:hypothetical protein
MMCAIFKMPLVTCAPLRVAANLWAAAVVAFALSAGPVCSASEHGSAPKHGASEHAEEAAHGEGEAAEEDSADANIGGIRLGEFKIRSDYPVEAQKSTVRFVLYASVKTENSAEMKHVVEQHEQKLRDLIITTTRLLPLIVFEEPDLATFRRRLLVRIRRALPQLTVDDLHVTDFSLIVKSL